MTDLMLWFSGVPTSIRYSLSRHCGNEREQSSQIEFARRKVCTQAYRICPQLVDLHSLRSTSHSLPQETTPDLSTLEKSIADLCSPLFRELLKRLVQFVAGP